MMAGPLWTIRPLASGDLPRLRRVYADSVRRIAAAPYSPGQIRAWSAFADDAEAFARWIAGQATVVAADRDNAAVGFAGLDDDGRIASLYVAPEWMRRGVGSGLLGHLLAHAKSRGFARVSTEASHFSMPLFRRHGFSVADEETVMFNAVEFHRFRMQRELAVSDPQRESATSGSPDGPRAADDPGPTP